MIRTVVGILRRHNKVLAALRPQGKPYSGYWEFPGGKIEENEKSQDALVRELQEELGVLVTSAELWFEHEHIYPDKTVHLDIYLVTEFQGEPKQLEHEELRWVTIPEMAELRLLEGNWPIIDKMKSLFLS